MNAERLFVVGPASWELFAPAFKGALRAYGLTHEIVVCGFDREVRLWSGADEDFETNPPRAAIVFPEARALFQPLFTPSRAEIAPEDAGQRAADFLLRAVASLSDRHPQVSWILSTAELPFQGALAGLNDSEMDPVVVALDTFNARVRRECRERAGWSLFERERVDELVGCECDL